MAVNRGTSRLLAGRLTGEFRRTGADSTASHDACWEAAEPRNGVPELKPYRWRAGDADRDAEVAALVLRARAEAARRIAAVDQLRQWE